MVAAAKRCARYLKSTRDFGLIYWKTWAKSHVERPLNALAAYTDADWAGQQDTRKSTAGCVMLFNGTAVSWYSKTLRTVALSSQDAEYMALSDGSREVVFLRNMLIEMQFDVDTTTVWGDNNGSLTVARNPANHQKTKHIAVRYHYIRQLIEDGEITVDKIDTTEQLADVMTKSLPQAQHKYLSEQIAGQTFEV